MCVAGSRAWEVRLHISFEAHMILSQAPDTTLGATGFGVFPIGFFYTLLCPDLSLLSAIPTLGMDMLILCQDMLKHFNSGFTL